MSRVEDRTFSLFAGAIRCRSYEQLGRPLTMRAVMTEQYRGATAGRRSHGESHSVLAVDCCAPGSRCRPSIREYAAVLDVRSSDAHCCAHDRSSDDGSGLRSRCQIVELANAQHVSRTRSMLIAPPGGSAGPRRFGCGRIAHRTAMTRLNYDSTGEPGANIKQERGDHLGNRTVLPGVIGRDYRPRQLVAARA